MAVPLSGPTDAQNAPLSARAPISTPTALTLSPGGVQAAVADSGTIYVARVHPSSSASGSPVTLGGNGSINTDGLRFLADGSHLLSASNDAVAVWNLSQIDRLAHTYRAALDAEPCNGCGGATIAISPNGRSIAALDDKGSIVVQTVGAGGGPPQVLRGSSDSTGPPIWDPRGSQLFVPFASGSAVPPRVVSTPGASPAVRAWSGGDRSPPVASALAGDGRHVIVVDSRADVMQEDPATGRTLATLPGPRDLASGDFTYQTDLGEAAIDPADGLVATVDHLDELNFGWGVVTVRNLASRRTLASIRGTDIKSIAYAGGRLLVQYPDGRLQVWNARGTQLERTLAGDQSFTYPPVGSPDGTLVARQRTDGSVVLADLATGSTLATFPTPADPSLGLKIGVGFSPSADDIVETVQTIAGSPPEIVQRDISARALLTAACRRPAERSPQRSGRRPSEPPRPTIRPALDRTHSGEYSGEWRMRSKTARRAIGITTRYSRAGYESGCFARWPIDDALHASRQRTKRS